jgi:hypothetical protein
MSKKSIKIITAMAIILVVLVASCWYIFFKPISSDEINRQHFKSGDEAYWVDAYDWLNGDTSDGSKFTSWWNYDFYLPNVSNHMAVLDNSKDNDIQSIANFHTATSEKEAVAVWIVRLLDESCKDNNGAFSENVFLVLEKYVGQIDANEIKDWIEKPISSPSYNMPIGSEYNENLSKQYLVGEINAVYHDVTELLTNKLDDDSITWLYHDIQQATGHSFRYYGVDGNDKQIFELFSFSSDKSLLFVALNNPHSYNLEDDFTQIKFIDTSEKKLTNDDLMEQLFHDESEQSPIENTELHHKDAYFDTMFYRTYIGPASGTSGQKKEFSYQLPCIDMKHFCAEFISNYSQYAYYQGKSAVVIAKYYEGAYINGSVTFMGEPLSAQVAIQKNVTNYGTKIPIDHDKVTTTGGKFNLIAPAGNITLQIRRNIELGENAFVLKNVTFDSNANPELFPISDDEAMRKEGTNYERIINIAITPANIEGYVYQNQDDNETYNVLSDKSLPDVEITLYEIEEFDLQTGNVNRVATVHTLATTNNGRYNASGLMPGFYLIRATLDDFVIHENYLQIRSGNNSYNISKPKPATVEGEVFYDENSNGEYDAGEELSNVDVELLYNTLEEAKKQVSKTTTDSMGRYSFSSLIPGYYILNATKLNTTTGYLDYEAEEYVMLNENETTNFDISMKTS